MFYSSISMKYVNGHISFPVCVDGVWPTFSHTDPYGIVGNWVIVTVILMWNLNSICGKGG